MPYIKRSRRPELDKVVEFMAKADINADGDLNYILFKYFKDHIYMKGKMSYNTCRNYRAELLEARDEIGRRFLAGYEDRKKEENGDV